MPVTSDSFWLLTDSPVMEPEVHLGLQKRERCRDHLGLSDGEFSGFGLAPSTLRLRLSRL